MAERWRNIKRRGLQTVAASVVAGTAAAGAYGFVEGKLDTRAGNKIDDNLALLQKANVENGAATQLLVPHAPSSTNVLDVPYAVGPVREAEVGKALDSLIDVDSILYDAKADYHALAELKGLIAEIAATQRTPTDHYLDQRARIKEFGENRIKPLIQEQEQKQNAKDKEIHKDELIEKTPFKADLTGIGIFVVIREIWRRRKRNYEEEKQDPNDSSEELAAPKIKVRRRDRFHTWLDRDLTDPTQTNKPKANVTVHIEQFS